MNYQKLSCRILACLIILVLVVNFRSVMIFRINAAAWWVIFIYAISFLYLALNLLSAWGLFFYKQWGFWLAYIAIVFTTIFFSINYIPYGIGYIPMIIGNIAVLIFIATLHFYQTKNKSKK